jgi:hypothetical protein
MSITAKGIIRIRVAACSKWCSFEPYQIPNFQNGPKASSELNTSGPQFSGLHFLYLGGRFLEHIGQGLITLVPEFSDLGFYERCI